jgi:hypothetical protein
MARDVQSELVKILRISISVLVKLELRRRVNAKAWTWLAIPDNQLIASGMGMNPYVVRRIKGAQ